MSWPAWWGRDEGLGTAYVPTADLLEAVRSGRAGRGWRWGGEWRTVEIGRGRVWKAARPWRSRDQWAPAMAEAQRAALSPPSSAPSALNAMLRRRGIVSRCVATLRYWGPTEVPGGWEATRHVGRVAGPLYWYDLNAAYAWAATLPLPAPGRVHRVDRWDVSRAVWRLAVPWPGDPRPYARIAARVWTWEERDAWGVEAPPVPYVGLAWSPGDELQLGEVLAAIAREAPALWALGRRGFWGAWASARGPEVVGLRSGTVRRLPNPYANPLWAALVTARVRLRLAQHWGRGAEAVHVYVDALVTRRPLEEFEAVGPAPGQWRRLGEFRGIEVRAPGVWRALDLTGRPIVRRAGHCGDPFAAHRGGDHGEAAEAAECG